MLINGIDRDLSSTFYHSFYQCSVLDNCMQSPTHCHGHEILQTYTFFTTNHDSFFLQLVSLPCLDNNFPSLRKRMAPVTPVCVCLTSLDFIVHLFQIRRFFILWLLLFYLCSPIWAIIFITLLVYVVFFSLFRAYATVMLFARYTHHSFTCKCLIFEFSSV